MTSALSWQNSVSLCPASFCTPWPNLPVTPGISSYFCIPVLYNEKGIFGGCYFQKVLQVFIEPFNFSFFSITVWGIDLDYCDIEWFALETNRDHSDSLCDSCLPSHHQYRSSSQALLSLSLYTLCLFVWITQDGHQSHRSPFLSLSFVHLFVS